MTREEKIKLIDKTLTREIVRMKRDGMSNASIAKELRRRRDVLTGALPRSPQWPQ